MIADPISPQSGFAINAETTYVSSDALKIRNIRSAIRYVPFTTRIQTKKGDNRYGNIFAHPEDLHAARNTCEFCGCVSDIGKQQVL